MKPIATDIYFRSSRNLRRTKTKLHAYSSFRVGEAVVFASSGNSDAGGLQRLRTQRFSPTHRGVHVIGQYGRRILALRTISG